MIDNYYKPFAAKANKILIFLDFRERERKFMVKAFDKIIYSDLTV
jgi:hypothetical protein